MITILKLLRNKKGQVLFEPAQKKYTIFGAAQTNIWPFLFYLSSTKNSVFFYSW